MRSFYCWTREIHWILPNGDNIVLCTSGQTTEGLFISYIDIHMLYVCVWRGMMFSYMENGRKRMETGARPVGWTLKIYSNYLVPQVLFVIIKPRLCSFYCTKTLSYICCYEASILSVDVCIIYSYLYPLWFYHWATLRGYIETPDAIFILFILLIFHYLLS